MIFKLGGLVMLDEDEYIRLCIEKSGQPQPQGPKEKKDPTSTFLESVRRRKNVK